MKILKCLLVVCILSMSISGIAFAGDIVKSKHFTLVCYQGCDWDKISKVLEVKSKDGIPGSLDKLYQEVADVLDIYVPSLKSEIRVYADRETMLAEAYKGSGEPIPVLPAVYNPYKNILYASLPDLTLGMLAHEITHTAIKHFFVVEVPTKVQEILAGYAEYNVRKARGESFPQAR